jgi:hypothetical protein
MFIGDEEARACCLLWRGAWMFAEMISCLAMILKMMRTSTMVFLKMRAYMMIITKEMAAADMMMIIMKEMAAADMMMIITKEMAASMGTQT